jgi:hypothetical protein
MSQCHDIYQQKQQRFVPPKRVVVTQCDDIYPEPDEADTAQPQADLHEEPRKAERSRGRELARV